MSGAQVEFFYDPVCPFAWITSRWVVEVSGARNLDITWRPISLKVLNEHRTDDGYTPEFRAVHLAGTQALRVAMVIDRRDGNDGVGRFYRVLGERLHPQGRRSELVADPEGFLGDCCDEAGLRRAADACNDESIDEFLRAETSLALQRTGPDVGTPICTFQPGTPSESSFFGPVMSRIPRGAEAVALWDAVVTMAATPGVTEVKRSLREYPRFD
jgi:2-hydroxychromene-2-carboxylate isomerase